MNEIPPQEKDHVYLLFMIVLRLIYYIFIAMEYRGGVKFNEKYDEVFSGSQHGAPTQPLVLSD